MSDTQGPGVLDAAVARTSAVLAAEPAGDRDAWTFARCWLSLQRYENGHDPAAIEAALADFDSLPVDVAGRAKLASLLVTAQIQAGQLREGPTIHRAAAHAAIADTDADPLPGWSATRAVIRALTLVQLCQDGDADVTPRTALAELAELTAVVEGQKPHSEVLEFARLALTGLRVQQDQDLQGAEEIQEEARKVSERYEPASPLHARAKVLAAAAAAQSAVARGDMPGAIAALEEIRTHMRALPVGEPARAQVEQLIQSVEPFLGIFAPGGSFQDGTAPLDAGMANLRRFAEVPGLGGAERAMRLANLGMAETAGGPSFVDAGVDHLAEAVAVAPAGDARLPFYTMSHGYALIQRYETARRPADLREGLAVLERARNLAGSPAHTYWATVSQMLAHAHRLSGDKRRGREIALEGLRGHAWSVLLQARTDNAAAAARDAAGDAIDVARWCLEDNSPADALTALDAGRGLIIYAATQIRDVAEQLAAEYPELAARWRRATVTASPADVDIDLRREVLRTLSESGSSRLLDPPSLHEVRAALTALRADALVYLMPGDQGTGAAVIVPARDEPAWCPLPALNAHAPTDFDLHRHGVRDADIPSEADAGVPTVQEVSDWAWDAAVRPVLARLDLPADGSGRVILIPMRELARIPWHAARNATTGEYAIRRAVFSYAASARLMCDLAWAGAVDVTGPGLIVGDPDTHGAARALPAARAEALAVQGSFYPAARYIGRLADGSPAPVGPGRGREILDWLADPDGGTMAHLACHAVVKPGDSSYLLLADGDHLSAEALVGHAGRDIALATLAACSTGVSSRGYDEAFSLATTFLASGVRSVVSAQWPVPDEETSVLMYMFHHNLQAGADVATALREAQLWILDRNRKEPADMPASLRARLDPGHPIGISAWAGFVHSGR